jgi:excisionase family DNA binding protein
MNGKYEDIMTVEEAASYLRVPKSTLYKLVREGRIPSHKVGRHWRFRKAVIDRWLEEMPDSHSQGNPEEGPQRSESEDSEA